MAYFLLGLATGTLISGLIVKYYEKESGWVHSSYLLGLSALLYLFSIGISWPLLHRFFS